MVQHELTQEERDELVNVLRSALSELRMEISATDGADYRDALKERKEVLVRLLATLGEDVADGTPAGA